MNRNFISYLAPLIVLLAFILDGQLSTLMINWSPSPISISSHILIILGIFLSFQIPILYSLILYALIGLIYDLYYFGVIGIAITLLPLSIYLIYYFYQNLKFKLFTNLIILMVVLFIFEFLAFILARIFFLTNLSMFLFVINDLLPTLVFNWVLLLLLHPLLKLFFGITNKT